MKLTPFCVLCVFSYLSCTELIAQNSSTQPNVQGRTWTDTEGNTVIGDFIETRGTRIVFFHSQTRETIEWRCVDLIRDDQQLICQALDARSGALYVNDAKNHVWTVASDGRQFIGRLKTVVNGELAIDQRTQELSILAGVMVEEDQRYVRDLIEGDDRLTLDRLVGRGSQAKEQKEDRPPQATSSGKVEREAEPVFDPRQIEPALDDTRRQTFADKANALFSSDSSIGTNWMNIAILAFAVSVLLVMGLIAWRHIADSFADTD